MDQLRSQPCFVQACPGSQVLQGNGVGPPGLSGPPLPIEVSPISSLLESGKTDHPTSEGIEGGGR